MANSNFWSAARTYLESYLFKNSFKRCCANSKILRLKLTLMVTLLLIPLRIYIYGLIYSLQNFSQKIFVEGIGRQVNKGQYRSINLIVSVKMIIHNSKKLYL